VFYEFTDLVEPLSLDEAFLDVTENKFNHPSATLLAQEIRRRIKVSTGLNASAGISINKFVAKVASDINKPNGQKTIPPEDVLAFLESLPIEKFFGVGKVTADRMNKHGIFNGADLKKQSLEYLSLYFGKSGKHYYDIVRGVQYSQVVPDRLRKSIAAERTFSTDLSSSDFMLVQLDKIADELEKRLIRSNVKGKTVTVKLKFSDFTQQTRSKTLPLFVNRKLDFFPVVEELMAQEPLKGAVRLLGISVTKLDSEEVTKSVSAQLTLDF
jgi:DNA polymerase-4